MPSLIGQESAGIKVLSSEEATRYSRCPLERISIGNEVLRSHRNQSLSLEQSGEELRICQDEMTFAFGLTVTVCLGPCRWCLLLIDGQPYLGPSSATIPSNYLARHGVGLYGAHHRTAETVARGETHDCHE